MSLLMRYLYPWQLVPLAPLQSISGSSGLDSAMGNRWSFVLVPRQWSVRLITVYEQGIAWTRKVPHNLSATIRQKHRGRR